MPEKEEWYVWKEYVVPEHEDMPRLLTPWADDRVYEFAFDFLFPSIHDALQGLDDWNVEPEESKDWVLCKMTLEPIQPTVEV